MDSLGDGKLTVVCLRGFRYESSNLILDLVSHPAEDFYLLLGGTGSGSRIHDTPVQKTGRKRKDRAPLLGRITHGDHESKMLFQRLGNILGLMRRDVDASFLHDFVCQGIQWAGFDSRAHNVKVLIPEGAQKTLGHLTASGVASRKKQNLRFTMLHFPSSLADNTRHVGHEDTQASQVLN